MKVRWTAQFILTLMSAVFLVVANTAYHRAFPPAFLNSVWTIIAMVALSRRKA
jgi:hypothetical protein